MKGNVLYAAILALALAMPGPVFASDEFNLIPETIYPGADSQDTKQKDFERMFPDSELRKYLKVVQKITAKTENVENELAKIETVNLSSYTGIQDFRGLEKLSGLKFLTIQNNSNLGYLDLTENTNLATFTCTGNKNLVSFALPDSVTSLTCENNPKLHQLNLSNLSGLTTLKCSNNALLTLTLPESAPITTLNCSGNQLTNLSVKSEQKLNLDCSNNNLTELNLTSCTQLNTVNCSKNKISKLTLPTRSTISKLNCAHNALPILNLENCLAPKATYSLEPQTLYCIDDNGKADINKLGIQDPKTQIYSITGAVDNGKLDILTAVDPVNSKIVYTYKTGLLKDKKNEKDSDQVVMSVTLLKRGSTSDTVSPAVPDNNSDETAMNRLYNPNSGEHFYTSNRNEASQLVAIGWKNEGIAWTAPVMSSTPVYRLYNPNAGDHHYTIDLNERDTLVRLGWKDEGIGWYSADSSGLPIYRQYNPNAKKAGAHHYTASKDENDYLVDQGWKAEGIAWYGVE